MAHYPLELFGCFVYHQDLTYDDLLTHEANLMDMLQTKLEALDGVFIDFVQTGDLLQVQCMFSELSTETLDSVSSSLAQALEHIAEGRFLLINKHLDRLEIANMTKGRATLKVNLLGAISQ